MRAKEELEKTESLLKLILDSTDEGVFGVDKKNRCTFINKSALKMLGYSSKEVIGKQPHRLWHNKYADGSPYPLEQCGIHKALKTGIGSRIDNEVYWSKNGKPFPVEYSTYPITDSEVIKGAVVTFTDITERKKIEEKNKQTTQDLALLNALNSAVNQGESLEKITTLLYKETKKIFGSFSATIYFISKDKNYLEMLHKPHRYFKELGIDKLIDTKIDKVRIRLDKDGVYRSILDSGSSWITNNPATIKRMMAECTDNKMFKRLIPVIYKALSIQSVISVPLISENTIFGLLDISRHRPFDRSDMERLSVIGEQITVILKRKEADKKLFHMATHDPLTDLSNRRVMDEALRRAVARAQRGTKSILIYLDMNHFKEINDLLGHVYGDQILIEVAKRIKGSLRSEDILARVGGDEFAVLMEHASLTKGQATAERINQTLCGINIPAGAGDIKLGCSSGIVLIDGQFKPETLLDRADRIMYRSKNKEKPKE